MDLSATDIKILTLLQQDASLTAAEIAEQVNLSVSPCWRRINRLEREGVIEKEVALLSAEKLGMGMVIFVTAYLRGTGAPVPGSGRVLHGDRRRGLFS
jgi:Lrp/AsnC family transcriptional regulator